MNEGRRTALVVTVLAGAAFVALAAWWVPWQPIPGGSLEPVPPTSVFTAEEIDRAEGFARWSRVWSWSSLAVSLLVACGLGFTSAGRRLVDRLPGPWAVRVVLAVAALALIGRVVTLPFAVLLRRHLLEYGLTEQSWAGFALDVAKSELLGILVSSLGLLALLSVARRWPRAWPVVAGGALGVLVLVGSFVYPVVVEPLFNSFTPLPDGPLRSRVLALAEAEGVHVDDVLVADASRRTTTLNAYVSGFGGTRRVVLYDTLVEDLPQDQALSVVAHELAHARHDDVVTGSLLGGVGVVFAVGLLGVVLGGRRGRRLGARADAGVVPLVLALTALGGLAAAPVQNAISRQIETRADVDALVATGDGDAFVGMQRRLALRSLADPTPPAISRLWFASHPGVLLRTALAERVTGADARVS